MASSNLRLNQGTSAGGPRYREAYPRLNIAAAERAMHDGRTVCVYNRGRRRVGHAECDTRGDEHFLIKYQIIPDMPGLSHERGLALFQFVTSSNSAVGFKRYFLCPACSKQRQSLRFARSWACAECHGLLSRSQVIPASVSSIERLAALKKLVGRGRPLRMHSRTYERTRAELGALEKAVARMPFAVASEDHCRIVEEEWRSLEEDADWQSDLSANWWLPNNW